MGSYSPNHPLGMRVDRDGETGWIISNQKPPLALFDVSTNHHFFIHRENENRAGTRCQRSIYDQYITIMNSGCLHGITFYPNIKCRGRTTDD